MPKINVNPTRMELTNLKKKLATAMRGHKLLKDKRDELMRQFLLLIKENQSLRLEVEQDLKEAHRHMALVRSLMSDKALDVALMLPKQEIQIDIEKKNVMSLDIPSYSVSFKSSEEGDIYSYGYAFTPGDLDDAIKLLSDALPKMIRLAEVEKSCQLLSAEIEKNRRRVNALEHVVIPQYRETIRYIKLKLDENERGTITRLMKVKDMMLEQVYKYKEKI
ncbi:MAG TPA: V-type ATP synthase subunit D [Clostridia bacterium]